MSDPMIRLLADLPRADPDSARAERTRIRCRTRLAGLARASTSSALSPRGRKAQLWQPLIAVLTNTIEGFLYGILKRGIDGVYHYVGRRHVRDE